MKTSRLAAASLAALFLIVGCASSSDTSDDDSATAENYDDSEPLTAYTHGMGGLPPSATSLANPGGDAADETDAPGAFDWSAKGYVTPVKMQGYKCGSCWAFATTGAFESAALIAKGKTYAEDQEALSEQYMLQCSGAGSCKGGIAEDAATFLQKVGEPNYSADPYIDANNATAHEAACPAGLADHKLATWNHVNSTTPETPSVNALKNALKKHGPLVTFIWASQAFENYPSGTTNGVFDDHRTHLVSESVTPWRGHYVIIVGYDDSLGAFKIKNSWDTTWGEAGYAWVKYGRANIGRWAMYLDNL